jgi:putative ABC transport system permease protein
MAGSYPAFYLTAFEPVDVMKGSVQKALKGGTFRNMLVVFQFFISIALIICTLLVFKQLNFLYHKDVGLNKEHALLIPNGGRLQSNYRPFMEELKSQSYVTAVSNSSYYPPGYPGNTAFRPEGSDQDHLFSINRADYDYYNFLEIEFVLGRNFSRDFPSDSNAVILNRAAIENLGWDISNPSDIINKTLIMYGGGDDRIVLNIIGVVEDYNFESLREEIKPMVTVLGEFQYWIGARINGTDNISAIKTIETLWKKHAPEEPFEFRFMDEEYDRLFRAEQRLSKVFSIFTVLAIIIACLGLLGLATFTAQQKTKEIGIRKALGASVKDVIFLLSKEFTKLVLISFILAVPAAYFIIKYWLNDFEYRTSIGMDVFLYAGTGALVIAWLTVSYQAISAAIKNPTNSLRYE